jgi:branched-chain amino acid transport system substrate-binding protein
MGAFALMPKAGRGFLFPAAAAAWAVLAGCQTPKSASGTIKVGVILPLTGDGAALGSDCRNGIELAADEFRSLHTTPRAQVDYEDSQGRAEMAISAFNKLRAGGAQAIIGDLFSGPTLAIAPLAERYRILVFSPGASNPKLAGMSKYVFRNYPSDNLEGKLIAKLIRHRGYSRIAVLYPTDDYGVGLKGVFESQFGDRGASVVFSEGYADNETNFRNLLTKAKQNRPDAFYLPGYYKSIALLAVQLRGLGLNQPLFSNIGAEDPQLVAVGGQAVEAMTYTAPDIDFKSSDPIIAAFTATYTKRFGKGPGFPAAHGYDTAKLLLPLIAENGADADKLRAALLQVDFQGVTGRMHFTAQGDVVKAFAVKTVKNGAFVFEGRISL